MSEPALTEVERLQMLLENEQATADRLDEDRQDLRAIIAERDRMLEAAAKGMEAIRAALAARDRQLAELREAVVPFAALADSDSRDFPGGLPVRVLNGRDLPSLDLIATFAPKLPTLGDCRKLADLLPEPEKE